MLGAVRAALALLLVSVGFVACAQDAQPTAGPGWRLVDVRGGNLGPGIEVHPLGSDAYLVELTVLGPGANDCGLRRFIGFEPRDTVLVARFEHAPIAETCLVITHTVFDVIVERRFIPEQVSRLELSEPCSADQPGCPGRGVAIGGPGGTTLPEPVWSAPPPAESVPTIPSESSPD